MYSVSLNGTWTNDGKATKAFFEAKGCVVNPARLIGDFDVFVSGKKVAVIFNSQADQVNHLKSLALI